MSIEIKKPGIVNIDLLQLKNKNSLIEGSANKSKSILSITEEDDYLPRRLSGISIKFFDLGQVLNENGSFSDWAFQVVPEIGSSFTNIFVPTLTPENIADYNAGLLADNNLSNHSRQIKKEHIRVFNGTLFLGNGETFTELKFDSERFNDDVLKLTSSESSSTSISFTMSGKHPTIEINPQFEHNEEGEITLVILKGPLTNNIAFQKITDVPDFNADIVNYTLSGNVSVYIAPRLGLNRTSIIGDIIPAPTFLNFYYLNLLYSIFPRKIFLDTVGYVNYLTKSEGEIFAPMTPLRVANLQAFNQCTELQKLNPAARAFRKPDTADPREIISLSNFPPAGYSTTNPTIVKSFKSSFASSQQASNLRGMLRAIVVQNGKKYYFWRPEGSFG